MGVPSHRVSKEGSIVSEVLRDEARDTLSREFSLEIRTAVRHPYTVWVAAARFTILVKRPLETVNVVVRSL